LDLDVRFEKQDDRLSKGCIEMQSDCRLLGKIDRAFMVKRVIVFSCALIVLSGLSLSCATAPPPAPQADKAVQAQRETQITGELMQELEAQLKFKKEASLSKYLAELETKLMENTPEIRGGSPKIFMIRDQSSEWCNYEVPGPRVYLSIGFLKNVEFENELAAAIALELAHEINRDALTRFNAQMWAISRGGNGVPVKPDKDEKSILDDPFSFVGSILGTKQATPTDDLLPPQPGEKYPTPILFGPNGIFTFSDQMLSNAAKVAVGILYRAGFDSRGLVGFWKKFQDHPENSPFGQETLTKVLEVTRAAVSQFAPLRNPVVRSKAFLSVQKRILSL